MKATGGAVEAACFSWRLFWGLRQKIKGIAERMINQKPRVVLHAIQEDDYNCGTIVMQVNGLCILLELYGI